MKTENQTKANIRRVLVVDDDPDVRRVVSKALTETGYEVECAEDGEAAWQAIQNRAPELVITDQAMPKLQGTELLKRIREAQLNIPVIVLTGTLSVPLDCFFCDAMLLKPFSHHHIRTAVDKLVGDPSDRPRTQTA